jgi:hypothetical protein
MPVTRKRIWYEVRRIVKFIKEESRLVVARVWDREKWGVND